MLNVPSRAHVDLEQPSEDSGGATLVVISTACIQKIYCEVEIKIRAREKNVLCCPNGFVLPSNPAGLCAGNKMLAICTTPRLWRPLRDRRLVSPKLQTEVRRRTHTDTLHPRALTGRLAEEQIQPGT